MEPNNFHPANLAFIPEFTHQPCWYCRKEKLYLQKYVQKNAYMKILISCAKTMAPEVSSGVPRITEPQYLDNAMELAGRMAAYSVEELMDILKVSPAIASENCIRYRNIINGEAEMMPALFAYTGMVFKHIAPEQLSMEELEFAHSHLRITSFLYGLLKPLDAISPYRLEGSVHICRESGKTVFSYWREILTDSFIDEIKTDGGILVNLASGEMKDLFDWKKVEKEVKVIQPEFMIQGKDRKPKTVTVYAKQCRGEMTRRIIQERMDSPEQLTTFEFDGFRYNPSLSSDTKYVFIK